MAPPVPEKVYLEHWMPGRARLRVPRPRSPERFRRIAGRAGGMRRVRHLDANAGTGSLLLTVPVDDPLDILIDDLRLAGIEVISPQRLTLPTVQTQSAASSVVRRLASTWNARLHMATNGSIDMRFVVPALYLLMALRNFGKQRGRLRDAPWYQLAWWAFDSFFKLHEEATTPAATGKSGRIVS